MCEEHPNDLQWHAGTQYQVSVSCRNCGRVQTISVEKGILVGDELADRKCFYCRCQMLVHVITNV